MEKSHYKIVVKKLLVSSTNNFSRKIIYNYIVQKAIGTYFLSFSNPFDFVTWILLDQDKKNW